MPLTLTSSAFAHSGAIPRRYTCQGDDVSVPLAWSGAPAATKSYALDTLLPAMENLTKADLEQAMKGHVLEKAELIGTYQKQ